MEDIIYGLQGLGVPPWLVLLLMVVMVMVVMNMMKKNVPATKAKGILVRSIVAGAAERKRMEEEALEIVGDDPEGLVTLAHEALRRGRPKVAEVAVERLRKTGKRSEDLRRLERELQGSDGRNAEREMVAIKNFLDEGLAEMARRRLDEALARWPEHEALRELDDLVGREVSS